jgi:1,4-dihydroxy-2-naphthoate octaprenyltransferase
MMGIGAQELLLILVVVVIGVFVGRVIVLILREDQRKTIGGIAILFGVILFVYGISSIRSAESALGSAIVGVLVGVTGFVVISAKGSSQKANSSSATKKCPFCAETIQAEAKFCRFCGKELVESNGK